MYQQALRQCCVKLCVKLCCAAAGCHVAMLLSYRALWAPGTDPYRSVATQVGTNYMEWPGLKELDQEDGQAGD